MHKEQCVQSREDIVDLQLNKDAVNSFIKRHESEFDIWMKNRISPKQVDYLSQLVRRANNSNVVSLEWITYIHKSDMDKYVSQLQNEIQKASALGKTKTQGKWFKMYDGTEYKTYQGVAWDIETTDTKQKASWNKMLFELSSMTGQRITVPYENYEMLKEVIAICNQLGNSMDYISQQLTDIYPFSKEELESIGLNITQTMLNNKKLEVMDSINDIKDLIKKGYLSKEEILKALS